MHPFCLLWLAVLLALFTAYSLFKKSETIRGLGRLVGGVSTLLLAGSLLWLSYGSHELPAQYGLPSLILLFTGLVNVGSGVHKFRRRNLPSQ